MTTNAEAPQRPCEAESILQLKVHFKRLVNSNVMKVFTRNMQSRRFVVFAGYTCKVCLMGRMSSALRTILEVYRALQHHSISVVCLTVPQSQSPMRNTFEKANPLRISLRGQNPAHRGFSEPRTETSKTFFICYFCTTRQALHLNQYRSSVPLRQRGENPCLSEGVENAQYIPYLRLRLLILLNLSEGQSMR